MQSKKLIQKIDILTGIRFLAAIHVVLFHNFAFFDLKNISPWITNFIYKGEAAVSFFFILSGYILTHAYKERLNDSKQKRKYFFSRLAKLYPLYLFAFVIDLPRGLDYFFSQYPSNEATIKSVISGLAHILMLQSWIPRVTASWNPPAWSLSCELFFYIVFIFSVKPMMKSLRKKTLIIILYFFPIATYIFATYFTIIDTNTSIFHTFWRSFPLLKINEFFIGILLYGLHLQEDKFIKTIVKNGNIIFWGSIVISFILTTVARPYIPREIFSSALYVPIFSLIIITSQNDKVFGKKYFESKALVYLGTISYALYILHQPIATYFSLYLENSLFKGIFYLCGALLSHLCYRYIEKPCQKKLTNLIK